MSIADKFIKRVAPALSTTIGYIRTATSYLTPKDDWVEGLKRRLAVAGDPFFRPLGRPLIFECHDDDYFATAQAESDKVEVALFLQFQRNLTSTRKYRTVDGDRDWADGSWVYDPDDTEWQLHVYLFDNGDGTTDLYAHKETSAEKDPYGHVTDPQTHGDPDGIVKDVLRKFDIEYKDV